MDHKKLRASLLREQILSILGRAKKPLTAPDLLMRLERRDVVVHKTSLYRQLDALCVDGVVELVLLDTAIAHYEIVRSHHHHVVCSQCHDVHCVGVKEIEHTVRSLERSIQRKTGFAVTAHQFSFSGICAKCH